MHARRMLRFVTAAMALAVIVPLAGPAPAAALDTRSGNPLVVPEGERVVDTFVASGDTVSLAGDFDSDVLASGGTVGFSGTAHRNLLAVGGRVRIDGTVDGDVFVAGGTVEMGPSAKVKGNVYGAGGQVRMGGTVDGELFAAGGQLDVEKGGSVGKSAAIAGGTLNVAGPISRDLFASGGTLVLASSIGGSVRAEVDQLEVSPDANVGGDLTYISRREAQVPSGAVSGKVTRVAPRETETRIDPIAAILGGLLAWLQSIVGMLLFGLLLVVVAPGTMTMSERRVERDPWRNLGIGVLTALAVPAASGVLLVAGVFLGGWWIALFALVALVIALLAGYVVAAMCLARWLLERFSAHSNHPLLTMALGVVLLGFVAAVPFVGWAVAAAASAVGLGALLSEGYSRRTHLPDAERIAQATIVKRPRAAQGAAAAQPAGPVVGETPGATVGPAAGPEPAAPPAAAPPETPAGAPPEAPATEAPPPQDAGAIPPGEQPPDMQPGQPR